MRELLPLQRALARCPAPGELRRELLEMADDLAPDLLGAGTQFDAWRPFGIAVHAGELRGAHGLARMEEHGAIVTVSANDPPQVQRFTIAHELGHLLMARVRRDGIDLSPRDEEQFCDEFASRLLVPREDLDRELRRRGEQVDALTLLALASRYGVSISAVLYAMRVVLNEQSLLILAATRRAHPARPDALKLRARSSRSIIHFVPNDVSLETLGFGAIEPALEGGAKLASGSASDVAIPLWRPSSSGNRSGRAAGSARWEATRLKNGLVLVVINTSQLQNQWWAPATGAVGP